MAKVLVVGGAGYIGSHMMKALVRSGHQAVAYDNFSTGHRDAILYGELVEGCLSDSILLRSILKAGNFDAVMHFASNIEVGESISDPRKYYNNNVLNTLNLIHSVVEAEVSKFIFSSSAAVYGVPVESPISEKAAIQPVNPYGRTKAMIEAVLSDYRESYGFSSSCLRYFNAAGADPDGELGERHEPESHLIPLAIQAALGRRSEIKIFGDDYKTPDGTCVRDYIHVSDICDAHLLALSELLSGEKGCSYNLGNGGGFSVYEVIDSVERISGQSIPTDVVARRPGDPAVLVSNSALVKERLGWNPLYTELDDIIMTAWDFYLSQSRRG